MLLSLSRSCHTSLVYILGRRKIHPKFHQSNLQAREKRHTVAVAGRAAALMANDPGAAAKVVVLYHYPCPDGVFAALAAYLYHSALCCRALYLPNPVYKPLRVQDLKVEGVDVFYLLDFAGPNGFALELSQKAKQVVVLDHHKTALESLPRNGACPSNLLCVLDMNRSGATIAFDYFEEKLQSSQIDAKALSKSAEKTSLVPGINAQRVKALFKYIEDADLWKWALLGSKAFSSGLNDAGIDFSATANAEVFEQLLELNAEHLIAKGQASLKAKQVTINDALDKSFPVELGRGKYGTCLAVRADSVSHLRSELGNQLAAKSLESGLRPIGAVVYIEPGSEESERLYKVSLRSRGDTADTTEISKAYGGGGHCNASSFMISRDELELWKVKL